MFANIASMLWNNLVKGRDTGSHGASGQSSRSRPSIHAQAHFVAAIYSVVSFLACVAPRMTFQLYGIIPIPAWLAVAGIFTYDTYSAINDKVSLINHLYSLLNGSNILDSKRAPTPPAMSQDC